MCIRDSYGTELTSGKHFVIHTYENNVKIGDKTASVTVIGNEKNGFTGTLTENFSIVANAGILEVSGVESLSLIHIWVWMRTENRLQR